MFVGVVLGWQPFKIGARQNPQGYKGKFENGVYKITKGGEMRTGGVNGDKGRGDAAVTKTKRLRRAGRRQRGLMGLPCLLDADGSLSRFPGRNLVRHKSLVQGATTQVSPQRMTDFGLKSVIRPFRSTVGIIEQITRKL